MFQSQVALSLQELSIRPVEEIISMVKAYQENTGKNLLNAQDNSGRTLAHYIAECGVYHEVRASAHCLIESKKKYLETMAAQSKKSNNIDQQQQYEQDSYKEAARNIQPYLNLLFENGADFSIQDKDGNTPLHLAIMNCKKTILAARIIVPQFIRYAEQQGFDFSTLNNRRYKEYEAGISIVHLLMSEITSEDCFGNKYYENNLLFFLETVKLEKKVLNVLSFAMQTPLYCAVESQNFAGAIALLESGADPKMGFPNPVAMIEEQITNLEQRIVDCENDFAHPDVEIQQRARQEWGTFQSERRSLIQLMEKIAELDQLGLQDANDGSEDKISEKGKEKESYQAANSNNFWQASKDISEISSSHTPKADNDESKQKTENDARPSKTNGR